jgi:hypothetical protein
MGSRRFAGASSRNKEETRRTSALWFADDHLEQREGSRSSGMML